MPALKARDLKVGSRYLHKSGQQVRVIDGIDDGTVHFHDESAPLRCSSREFLETVSAETPAMQEPSREAILRVFGGEVNPDELIEWHDSLKTQCALVSFHADCFWSSFHSLQSKIMGAIGYDSWRHVDGHLNAVQKASERLQGTLATFEAS